MAQPAMVCGPMADKPRELVIGDPHDQLGLVAHIANGVGPVQVINYYHFWAWPKEKAYCAKCAGHRHRDGFTIELEDGTYALAGSKCASDLWGEQWKAVRKTFQRELDAAGIILDVRSVLPELKWIRAALDQTWRPVIEQVAAHQKRFKGMMGPLYNALKRAANRSDHCVVINGKPLYYVEGWSFFATDDILQHFQLALKQIDVAIGVGHGQQTEFGAYTVTLGDARDNLDTVAHATRGLRNFFAPNEVMDFGHLIEGVTRSLSALFRDRYTLRGGRIIDLLTEQSIGMPDGHSVLNAEPLRRLRDLKS